MSAFLCSEDHINALATFAAQQGLVNLNPGDVEFTAKALASQNARSLLHHYGKHALPDANAAEAYTFKPYNPALSAAAILKLAQCYEHQACETHHYEQTVISRLIHHIKQRAVALGAQANGREYNAAAWSI